jgi:hypothetical protein
MAFNPLRMWPINHRTSPNQIGRSKCRKPAADVHTTVACNTPHPWPINHRTSPYQIERPKCRKPATDEHTTVAFNTPRTWPIYHRTSLYLSSCRLLVYRSPFEVCSFLSFLFKRIQSIWHNKLLRNHRKELSFILL